MEQPVHTSLHADILIHDEALDSEPSTNNSLQKRQWSSTIFKVLFPKLQQRND